MNKLKKILVATDFSEHSQFAILKAVELAKTTKAHLTILHVAKKEFLEKVVEKVVPIIEKVLISPEEYAESLLKKQIEKLSKNNINVKYSIIFGEDPAPKILSYVKKHKNDLLILGAHGKYSIHDWFVGTTAEYIARKTPIPVLIIKTPSHKVYQKILIPIDFSKASKAAVQFATQLFRNVDFHLLHVSDYDSKELLENEVISKEKEKTISQAVLFLLKEKAKKFIKGCNIKIRKLSCDIKFGYPWMTIIDESKKLKQDLVVMGTEGHSQRHYLFIGRVASRVLIEIDRDILLVPNKK